MVSLDAGQNLPTQEQEAEGANYQPVSLPALFSQDFNGSNLKLGEVLDDNAAYTRYFITYQSGELSISGIMNVPKGAGPFPLIILNHGHIDTAVYTNGRGLKREQDYLARQGYVVLHTDYRNHAQSDEDNRDELAVRLAYAEDAVNAVYAIKNSDFVFIYKENIGMLGHSMGGGVTLQSLVIRPDLIKAVVLYAPVSGNLKLSYDRWLARRTATVANLERLYGSPAAKPEFWQNLSAENFYDKITAPVAIYHGTVDQSVPLEWSAATRQSLANNGVEADLTVYQGAPHEFISDWPDFMASVSRFFDRHLKVKNIPAAMLPEM
ncbi:MAG: Peptidase S9 prolyl oligopeptidase active site domain protein [Parcubacteria group bacterium GW2011_GWA2_43_17]|nr:MAG: Peptidase S9 prolyl oligopeptidase active site domain protein [Parcubacteria group bacterium GW2011_GWA2_43_17]KKT97295.1 MAG: Peptidase S9 prolyl oligopeptidase active site domain protein [Parcubacteria group bacterium GW2011_GWC2_45_15]HAH04892.1 peptidase S9 [Candidatus Komeilibacteria bacterium]